MSKIPSPPTDLSRGPDLYLEWIDEYLGLSLSAAQREILRSMRENKRTLVVGANGFGKTYGVTAGALAFLFCHYPSKVVATSGTYGKLRRTMCRPLERMHRRVSDYGIPGEYKQSPPRIEFDGHPEWFFEAARPRDAGELEGTHAPYLLAIVEEADKENVDEQVLDSMDSLLTDDNDRMVVVANPPKGKANVVANLMENDETWNVLQYSSFESHNVGRKSEEHIDGLVTIDQIRDNWESWNRRPWPGLEAAQEAHKNDSSLDTRWYRRRAGVIPPEGASTYRPFSVDDVEQAFTEGPVDSLDRPDAFGIDVARAGGDRTVVTGKHDEYLVVHDYWQGADHNANEDRIRRLIDDHRRTPMAVDAQGEGSGIADRLSRSFQDAHRFNAGETAIEQAEYYDRWTEGLYHLGKFLSNGGKIYDPTLREELLVAARTISFDEKHYDSRGATVLKCTPKDKVKESLGRSPDLLDAAYMAIWAAEANAGYSTAVAFG